MVTITSINNKKRRSKLFIYLFILLGLRGPTNETRPSTVVDEDFNKEVDELLTLQEKIFLTKVIFNFSVILTLTRCVTYDFFSWYIQRR